MSIGERSGARDGLRETLRAVGEVLGVPVVVTDAEDWRMDDDGLVVGLGWYARRGHGEREAVALASLQLWEGPREWRRAPERARRRRSLAESRPEIVPLLDAVARLQALAELLSAMPGLRDPIAAAMRRSLPTDTLTLPRHLQWVALLLAQEAPRRGAVHDDVLAEWRGAQEPGGGEVDPVRRVLAPNPAAAPLRRLERALALLLPPYERLLAKDAGERGPAAIGTGGAADRVAPEPDPAGFGEHEAAGDGDEDASDADGGESDEQADPGDLFASEREAFVERMLATPMPRGGALFDAALDSMEAGPEPPGALAAAISAGAGDASTATELAQYRRRAEELAEAIERMRALWARIIAERVAVRRAPSRAPLPEGDELATDALAAAVAEALAGARRPSAFRRRVARPRRTRSVGSTDYVLMVDRSASMSGPVSEAAADAMLILVEALGGVERDIAHAEATSGIDLDLDLRSCLIVFGARASVVKPLSHGADDEARRRMHAAIREPEGSTNDGAALRAAAEQLGVGASSGPETGRGTGPGPVFGPAQGVQRRRVAILVSDGGSNDTAAADRELHRLRASGVRVHGIGVGSDDILMRYGPDAVRIDDPRRLPEALEAILEQELD